MRRRARNSQKTEECKIEEKSCHMNQEESKIYSWRESLPDKKTLFDNFEKISGFSIDNFTSYENFVRLLYRPTDPASLGVARALFGLCMVLDVVEERGLADIDIKWGDPYTCHFPLIHGMKPPSLPWMIVIYTIMWMGAFGIMLGFCFKLACACFVIPYWYIFLLDKGYWNNHSYLYGIVSLLFWSTNANRYFSIDSLLTQAQDSRVPLWNYFILNFQFFALYFLAGLKKSGREWLDGFSMTNLSTHWVFDPFKLFLTTEQTDFLIVHWFGYIFDLTVGFWMLLDRTRIPAMIFCTAFHLMNSRLFSIGMFPYVCLATMPLFCHTDWPRKIFSYFSRNSTCSSDYENLETASETSEDTEITKECIKQEKSISENFIKTTENNDTLKKHQKNYENTTDENCQKNQQSEQTQNPTSKQSEKPPVNIKQKFVVALLLCHVVLQFFLPYSHFITKGYNNWVPGLYGYSWDMMVHNWDTILVVVKVHDNQNNKDYFMDPQAWVQGDRWTKHGDMVRQYANCLKENLMRQKRRAERPSISDGKAFVNNHWPKMSNNLSIYIDVWCSLNGRFQQRMFNPKVDLLTTHWHPLEPVSYLMPLLTQFSSYRYKLYEIQRHVYTWSNYTDVLFVADYPGMHLDNFISEDLSNVTLTVLEGEIMYTEEDWDHGTAVGKDGAISIVAGKFHKIETISPYPACYMYTYSNRTRQQLESKGYHMKSWQLMD
ncbi:vitamin K-dependent gamma-carboxylase isoform X2 [Cephus cinctus]|uniref:Vitamin K-dependent gamma-carboxylase isoform X2 n=1 Tax=Cephus cinctus TaxID=211228 RepID=A0AAJ7RNX4_CEPCN|nr:vitamin K-dependent gamma-carboxylase isoform X2 [Cephus cinctus]